MLIEQFQTQLDGLQRQLADKHEQAEAYKNAVNTSDEQFTQLEKIITNLKNELEAMK